MAQVQEGVSLGFVTVINPAVPPNEDEEGKHHGGISRLAMRAQCARCRDYFRSLSAISSLEGLMSRRV